MAARVDHNTMAAAIAEVLKDHRELSVWVQIRDAATNETLYEVRGDSMRPVRAGDTISFTHTIGVDACAP